MQNTGIIDSIENDRRGQYQTAVIDERTLDLINRGLVVSRGDVRTCLYFVCFHLYSC